MPHTITLSRNSRILVALIMADVVAFGMTNSQTVPVYGLILGFLLMSATVYYLAKGLIKASSVYGIHVKNKHRLALTMTLVVSAVFALQSIGQLNRFDLAVVLPLVLIGYAYSSYGKTAKNPAVYAPEPAKSQVSPY